MYVGIAPNRISVLEATLYSEPYTMDPARIAHHRKTTPEKLADRLAAGLDDIILTALQKDPRRGFQTVQEFADTVENRLR